jgi:hypothetical protein
MRLSLLGAGAALAVGLALSASSAHATVSKPGLAPSAPFEYRYHGTVTRLMPGVKTASSGCSSAYVFCIVVAPGNIGPYVSTSAGSSVTLYNNAWITKSKSPSKIDKKFMTYFLPDPGNPTSQYINYTGKNPKKPGAVKFNDYYCIGFTPSGCPTGTFTFIIGVSLTPGT